MKKPPILFRALLAFALLVAIPSGCKPKAPSETTTTKPRKIVVLSFGGAFADAQRAAYFEPFTRETGIRIEEASYNGEYGKLKAAVQSGSVGWDVADIESSALIRGKTENVFTPIDYGALDKTDLVPAAVDSHAVGTDIYSVSLGFSTKYFPDGQPQPKDWRDFWDTRKFPGPRCLKKDARFTLEISLMADGVAAESVYANGQLDIERAFKSLDRIKPDVKVWWTTGTQPIQLLVNGEVAMAAAFGARMWNAQHKDKKAIVMSWQQSIMDTEYWAILRGSPNPKTAMEFIAFACRADRQAEFPKYIPLGPVNRKAFDQMDPWLASQLNTHPENLKKQIYLNAKWWAEHETALAERFNAWLAQ